MEAILQRGRLDQSISPHKSHIRNPRNIRQSHHPPISMPCGKFPPPDSHTIGLFPAPPPFISHSCPPQAVYQPPLLPLPAAIHRRIASVNKRPPKGNRTRDSSLTPKKSKFPRREAEISAGTSEAGPEPNAVNKPRFVSSSGKIIDYVDYCVGTNRFVSAKNEPGDVFSGSVAFATSPPPSSLPLPTFYLGPKLAVCRAEAAATDDIRRLLRLR